MVCSHPMEGGKRIVHRIDDGRRQAEAGLVEQQQLGIAHQRTADRQHLALATGHRSGALFAPFGEPREHCVDALEQAGRWPRSASGVAQHQIVLDALLGEQAPAFGDSASPLRTTAYAGWPAMFSPANVTLPAEAGTMPAIAFNVVVLPAPLEPSSATTEPRVGTSSDTSATPIRVAVAHLKVLDTQQRGIGTQIGLMPHAATTEIGLDHLGSLVTSRGVPRRSAP